MGRSRIQRRSTKFFDSDDDTLSSTSTGGLSDLTTVQEVEVDGSEDLVLDNHLDALYEKRASTRENGLKGFISAFTNDLQYEFVESKTETLLDQFMKSMKRGSSSEVALAAHAAGLLAITIGAGERAHKVMQDSIPNFSRACKIASDAENYSMVLQSLAVVTFVGGTDFEETEKSMDLLWQQISGTNKTQPAVKAAAISAWAFLLTTLPTDRLDSQFCKRCLPMLSTLLEHDNRAVRIAAGEAIALIFETVNSEDESQDDSNNLVPDSLDQDNVLENKILEQMKALSIEASGKGSSKKDLNSQRSSFRDFLASIEDGTQPEATVKLQNGDVVNVSTWTQIIQTNLLRHFLGGGFQKHMQVNSLLHEVFSFSPNQEKQQALSAKEKVFLFQKADVHKCNMVGKPAVITHVVDSMTDNLRPTRAEATDVANAVLDGTNAILLGAETFRRLYPIETISTVGRICVEAEKVYNQAVYFKKTLKCQSEPMSHLECIATSAVSAAIKVKASVIAVFTTSGRTAKLIAKYRPTMPVISVVIPRLTTNQLRWSFTSAFQGVGYGMWVNPDKI